MPITPVLFNVMVLFCARNSVPWGRSKAAVPEVEKATNSWSTLAFNEVKLDRSSIELWRPAVYKGLTHYYVAAGVAAGES